MALGGMARSNISSHGNVCAVPPKTCERSQFSLPGIAAGFGATLGNFSLFTNLKNMSTRSHGVRGPFHTKSHRVSAHPRPIRCQSGQGALQYCASKNRRRSASTIHLFAEGCDCNPSSYKKGSSCEPTDPVAPTKNVRDPRKNHICHRHLDQIPARSNGFAKQVASALCSNHSSLSKNHGQIDAGIQSCCVTSKGT